MAADVFTLYSSSRLLLLLLSNKERSPTKKCIYPIYQEYLSVRFILSLSLSIGSPDWIEVISFCHLVVLFLMLWLLSHRRTILHPLPHHFLSDGPSQRRTQCLNSFHWFRGKTKTSVKTTTTTSTTKYKETYKNSKSQKPEATITIDCLFLLFPILYSNLNLFCISMYQCKNQSLSYRSWWKLLKHNRRCSLSSSFRFCPSMDGE